MEGHEVNVGLEGRRVTARSALTLKARGLTLNESGNANDDFNCITEACVEETTEGFSQFHTELFGTLSEKLCERRNSDISIPKTSSPDANRRVKSVCSPLREER